MSTDLDLNLIEDEKEALICCRVGLGLLLDRRKGPGSYFRSEGERDCCVTECQIWKNPSIGSRLYSGSRAAEESEDERSSDRKRPTETQAAEISNAV